MRRLEDDIVDPDTAAALDAIDATLAGDPVDPRHAELAELALLLRGERPAPTSDFARSLDLRVEQRFASATGSKTGTRRRRWSLAPAAGLAAAAVVAAVIAASSGGAGRPSGSPSAVSSVAAPGAKSVPRTASAGGAASTAVPAPIPNVTATAPFPGLRLPQNNRKIVQSSQLALVTAPNRIDDVAQEVFDVIGAERGYVSNSSVTAGGPGGYANFQLSVPSAALAQTMTQLSQLRYAHVTARTDDTSDITGQFTSADSQLAQAQALRTSLLKQLQNASTQGQIASLQAQLSDANAKIASAKAALRSLGHQVDYSQIALTVQAGSVAPVRPSAGGGFTIGRAADDAGRVLTVAAGAALIALAVLVPLALVGGLVWWGAAAVRRRRRDQALDLA